MEQSLVNSIYEPFTQGARSRVDNNFKGSGLGMSIAKGLIDAMSGNIKIHSVVGKGSEFYIKIPFGLTNKEVINKSKASQNEIKDKKVMIVDDNDLNLEILDHIISKYGMKTVLVKNGFTAYQILKNSQPNEYNVVLMDILMPIMDGLEATKKIRLLEREDLKNIPIIGITANAYSEDEKKSLKAGMNAHIAKPIIEEKLINVLKEFL